MKKKVIITGCGRSGTLYMRHVLLCLGYDIGHEGFREDGITSWYIVDESRAIKVKEQVKDQNPVFIHLVRHPLDVISSMRRCEALPNRAALDFFRRAMPWFVGMPELDFLTMYWIAWNLQAERLYPFDMRIRVEDMNKNFQIANLCYLLNKRPEERIVNVIKDIGTKIHELKEEEKLLVDLKYQDLVYGGVNPDILNSLKELSAKYNYDLGLGTKGIENGE